MFISINNSIIPAYFSKEIKDSIINNYKYIFEGDRDYLPFMQAKTVSNEFVIDNIKIKTFKHNLSQHRRVECEGCLS